MNVIVSTNPDGSVGITTPSPEWLAAGNDLVALEADLKSKNSAFNPVAHIADSALPDNAGLAMEYVLDEDTLVVTQVPCPDQRRCFRNQWKWDGTAVVEDIVAVQEEKIKKAKAIRNRILEQSDKEEFILSGPDLDALRTWKQSLRDLGADISADPENVVWPAKP